MDACRAKNFWPFLFLLLLNGIGLLKGSSSGSASVFRQRGLLVVPGLGRPDRLLTVLHNVRALKLKPISTNSTQSSNAEGSGLEWDCLVYIYAERADTGFWGMTSELRTLTTYCSVVENPARKVTENLYLLQPATIRRAYKYVFILLDDCKVSLDRPVILDELVKLLECNALTVLSPVIAGANKGGGQQFRNIMQLHAPASTAGYVSSFVEIFAWIMTIPAYTALWELFCPWVNPYAWGYDFWYNGYASATVPGHRMGITNVYTLYHEQDVSSAGLGRTDNTNIDVKWKAVTEQERYYKKHLGIPLHMYRKRFDIANSSWNGAVKGYLHACK